MFLEHFGLIEQPFGVTPDPRFLHLGPKHREALAALTYAAETGRGFLALIAPPGMGKTSLLFHHLESLRNRARTAFLFQNANDARELMLNLLADLSLAPGCGDLPGMHAALNELLTEEMRAGRRLVLAIDEAQNLPESVLEAIRLLSNFETPWMKLIHIVLSGQPQLKEKLLRPSMRQLRQRISIFVRLDPFTPKETSEYINHRLWVAGCANPQLFTAEAQFLIAVRSEGIPRNINNLCFHAMSIACVLGKSQIDSEIVREAVADASLEPMALPPQSDRACDAAGAIPPGRPARGGGRRAVAHQPGGFRFAFKARRRLIAAIVSVSAALLLGFLSSGFWKVGARSDTQLEAVGAQPVLTVIVPLGATLRHLSLQYLGRFDPATLEAIRALNPTIADPNHLQAGQSLRLPLQGRPHSIDQHQAASGSDSAGAENVPAGEKP
jgi:general secretion pathway protein A